MPALYLIVLVFWGPAPPMLKEHIESIGTCLRPSLVIVNFSTAAPRRLTVTPIYSSQHLPGCESQLKLYHTQDVKVASAPACRDLSFY